VCMYVSTNLLQHQGVTNRTWVQHRIEIDMNQVVKVLGVLRRHRVTGAVGVREGIEESLKGALEEIHEGFLCVCNVCVCVLANDSRTFLLHSPSSSLLTHTHTHTGRQTYIYLDGELAGAAEDGVFQDVGDAGGVSGGRAEGDAEDLGVCVCVYVCVCWWVC
jgi:hypothetical protein